MVLVIFILVITGHWALGCGAAQAELSLKRLFSELCACFVPDTLGGS